MEVQVHQSLVKPFLFLGGEKTPVLINALVCGLLMLIFRSVLSFIIIFAVMVIIHKVIGKINSKEPQFFAMFARFKKHKKFYVSNSNVFSNYRQTWKVKND